MTPAGAPLQAAYDESSALMLSSFAHPDFTEGVESFVERRQAIRAYFTDTHNLAGGAVPLVALL